MQDLNRRSLLKLSAAAAAVSITPGVLLVTGCDTSWISTAINDLPTIGGIADSILEIIAIGDPAVAAIAPAISAALTAVKAGLATLQALITQYKAHATDSLLTQIDAALTDVQTNLSQVLDVAHIKNAALQATISVGISLAITVVQAIQSLIPSPTPVTSSLNSKVTRQSAAVQSAKAGLLSSAQIKAAYNVVAQSAGYAGQVVR